MAKAQYTEAIKVALTPEELENIDTIAGITGLDRSKVTRKALHNLFAHYELPTPWTR